MTFTKLLYANFAAIMLGLFARDYLGDGISNILLFGGIAGHIFNVIYFVLIKKKTLMDD
jgi:hypothetical protein